MRRARIYNECMSTALGAVMTRYPQRACDIGIIRETDFKGMGYSFIKSMWPCVQHG